MTNWERDLLYAFCDGLLFYAGSRIWLLVIWAIGQAAGLAWILGRR